MDLNGNEACVGGHELNNCPMDQYVQSNREIPQNIDANAKKGFASLYDVDSDELENGRYKGSVPLNPEYHIYTEKYRMVPYVSKETRESGKGGVKYYVAQNIKSGEHEFVVPPGMLDHFANPIAQEEYEKFGKEYHGKLSETQIETSRAMRQFMKGDSAGYWEHNAKAWKATAKDPYTYIGLIPGSTYSRVMARMGRAGVGPNKYTHSAPYSGNPLEPNFIGPRAPAAIPENPSAYSVSFEMRLDPSDFGKSRSVHFNRANAALDDALQGDADFFNMMDELIPGVQSSVSSVGGRATPSGWTWEHTSTSTSFGERGVMRLVPSDQHTSGSPFWRVLHPDNGASGGYSEWAIPNGAPKN